MTAPITCQHVSCTSPATTGGTVVLQPNGLKPTHAFYYVCGDHYPGLLEPAVKTWPVRATTGDPS